MKRTHPTVVALLQKLERIGINVSKSPVIKDNLYVLNGRYHLLVRSSRFFENRGYFFFGLTKVVFDNYWIIPDSYVAFICGAPESCFILPAKIIADVRHDLSDNSKQYKAIIRDGRLVFPRRTQRRPIDLAPFHNAFGDFNSLLPTTKPLEHPTEIAKGRHAETQGMLLEIGNLRGFGTYTPDRKPKFHDRSLGSIATLANLPTIPGIAPDVAGRVDVIWFDRDFPINAFEVELSTGIWSGLVRLGEFLRLSTQLHVVTDGDSTEFERRIGPYVFRPLVKRCNHASVSDVHRLHSAESKAASLRQEIGI